MKRDVFKQAFSVVEYDGGKDAGDGDIMRDDKDAEWTTKK